MKGNDWLKGKKGTALLVAAGVVGVVLVLLSGRSSADKGAAQTPAQYAAALEEQLGYMLASVQGVGECRVMVTVHNDIEYLYAGGGDDITTEIQPTVRGVMVVCSGGADEAVRRRVVEAVTTALGITSGRVCVEQLL